MQLLFATSNPHKIREIKSLAPEGIEITGLKDLGYNDDLPETQDTIEGNSLQKAEFVFERFGLVCFAEDTGLMIDALNGAPGVYSARYAGEKATFDDNIDKVLVKMAVAKDRKAKFKTIITYCSSSGYMQFEGVTEGEILEGRHGEAGFGYDAIFRPFGSDKSYAEMTLEEKNRFSHRQKSFRVFANHLLSISVCNSIG